MFHRKSAVEYLFGVQRCDMAQVIRFAADNIELDRTVGFIGFANSVSERYFWMQPGETSTGLSLDKEKIWLERDDQQWGGAGERWTIALTRHSVTIDTHQLKWMECDSIEIGYTVDDEKFQSMKSLLQTVMAGCPQDLMVRV